MFSDRVDAGQQLAVKLDRYRNDDVVVVGLPRGGVPVAREVALALQAPLDVIIVRKLGVPFQPELAMGAIGEGGVRVIDNEAARGFGVSRKDLATVEQRERHELERRSQKLRSIREQIPLAGRVVLVVDDGIATGSTARAACRVARAGGAARIVLAVPVAPAGWTARIGNVADEFVAIETPEWFRAVGQFYDDFGQTTDDEVAACLESIPSAASREHSELVHQEPPRPRNEEIKIAADSAMLSGRLTVPADAHGIVVFAHGSGSSRHSPRNRYVASMLNDVGLATLLFDLLTPDEEALRSNVFDIELLGRRLAAVAHHLRHDGDLNILKLGFFGASTGAAAALYAAAKLGTEVAAVVSRGGRPDLASPWLEAVESPTLLIVGDRDQEVLALNRSAQLQLRCPNKLATVPDATHLFEEPGTLRTAADLAATWFLEHLSVGS